MTDASVRWKQQLDRWQNEYIVDWQLHFEQYKRYQVYRRADEHPDTFRLPDGRLFMFVHIYGSIRSSSLLRCDDNSASQLPLSMCVPDCCCHKKCSDYNMQI